MHGKKKHVHKSTHTVSKQNTVNCLLNSFNQGNKSFQNLAHTFWVQKLHLDELFCLQTPTSGEKKGMISSWLDSLNPVHKRQPRSKLWLWPNCSFQRNKEHSFQGVSLRHSLISIAQESFLGVCFAIHLALHHPENTHKWVITVWTLCCICDINLWFSKYDK